MRTANHLTIPAVLAMLAMAPVARAQSASFPPVEQEPPPPSAPRAPSAGASTPGPFSPGTSAGRGPRAPQPAVVTPPAGGGVAGAPAALPYRQGQPVPWGYRIERSPREGLVLGGGLAFVLGYATGAGVAVANGFGDGTGWLMLPLAGPWVTFANRDNPCNDKDSATTGGLSAADADCVGKAIDQALIAVLAALDGVLQATGATLAVAGWAAKKEQLVRQDVAWKLAPMSFGRAGAGLQIRGRF